MQRKAPRRTRERILETALRLFNDQGEPQVTTSAIAEALNISPGNLYYHFRNKDDIVLALVKAFDADMAPLLQGERARPQGVEDLWLFLHLMFETIWRHRFIYRDLNDLMGRNRAVRQRMRVLLQGQHTRARQLCDDLRASGQMRLDESSAEALATNIVVVTTSWLAFEHALQAERLADPAVQAAAMTRGAFQVASLTGAYLLGDARRLFDRLAREYLPDAQRPGR